MNLVYCRECARAEPHSTAEGMYYCEMTHMRMSAEDFCSRGRRAAASGENALYSDAQWQLAGEWYAKGYTLREIAEFLGVQSDAVRQELVARGVELRAAGRQKGRNPLIEREDLEKYKSQFNALVFAR